MSRLPEDPPRTALITGANRGIGFAIAAAFSARNDMRVLIGARNGADGDAAAQTLNGASRAVCLDLADESRTAADIAAIRAEHGPIDILINNAAVLEPGGFAQPKSAGS